MLSASSKASDAGSKVKPSILPVVLWSVGSKRRTLSISSPKKSSRSACSSPEGERSTIPPRTANSPASVHVSTRTRSAERPVGEEWVSQCRLRWPPEHTKKKNKKNRAKRRDQQK